MGNISLSYSVSGDASLAALLSDIEYGVTFRRHIDVETPVLPQQAENTWVSRADSPSGLVLVVDDEFLLPAELALPKLMTALLFNCQDFGDIRLEDVSLNDSALRAGLRTGNADGWGDGPKFATVVKPYFHLTTRERVDMLARFQEAGFDAVKEDECFIVAAETILEIVQAARSVINAGLRYVPNINGFISDFDALRRIAAAGVRTVLVNPVVVGWNSVIELRRQVPDLEVWTHRVGYSTLGHRISVRAFTKLAVLAGSSVIHIGTPLSQRAAEEQTAFAPYAFDDGGWFRPVLSKLAPDTLQLATAAFGADGIYLTCGQLRDLDTGQLDDDRLREWSALMDKERSACCRPTV